jgi:anti-anti-sigma regulatory factor
MSSSDATLTVNAMAITLSSTLRVGDLAVFKQDVDTLLATAPGAPVMCDASAVEFIDAAALQWLTALAQTCSGCRQFSISTPSAAFLSAATLSGYAAPLGLVS